MRFHWSYIGCDKSDAEQIAELWRPRQAELEAKVEPLGRSEADHLRIVVERGDEAPAWHLRAALYHGGGVLAAEFARDDLVESLDELVSRLSQPIDEWLDREAGADLDQVELHGVLPLLQSCYERRKSDAFFTFLLPAIRSFRRYAQRELRTRRLLGELPLEQLTLRDVLDEAMLQAWNQFERRPAHVPFNLWLVRLIDETIEAGCRHIATESLDDRRPATSDQLHPSLPGEDEWVEQPAQLETIELSRLLPGAPGIEMWDDLDVETKRARLDEIFEKLSRSQRQALMLHAVEGFNVATIADFQDRTALEVEQDLGAARTILQRMAREPELPEIEERLERSTFKNSRRSHRT